MARRVVTVLGAPNRRIEGTLRAIASRTPSARLLEPKDQPFVGAVISDGRTPAISHWSAPDGSFCLIDGEIFNLPSVAGALDADPAQHVFKLFAREGEAALARLDAAAAIVLWDARRRELTVARDLTGSAPIFTASHDGCFYAASDLFSLIELGIERQLDLRALDYFLGHGYAPAPWTYLEPVAKIPAAHLIRIAPGGAPILVDYEPAFEPWQQAPSKRERLETIRSRLFAAVERRRAKSGPTGVLLSGGVDSALLLACLTRGPGVGAEAFTFRYGDYTGVFNEAEEASKIAAYFGAPHHVIDCLPNSLADNISGLVHDYGEPFTYGLHSFLLSEVKCSGIESVLSGIGSDGYNVDDSGLGAIYFSKLPRLIRRAAHSSVELLKPLFPALDRRSYAIFWSERTGLPSSAYPPNMHDEARRDLYADKTWFDRVQEETIASLRQLKARHAGRSDVDLWRIFSHNGFDSECMLFWNTAWARKFDVALHYPYFDIDLKAYMMRASPGGKGKHLIRKIAATMMPSHIANAPKVPQTIPIGHWFRGPLREVVLDYLAPARLQDLFDPTKIMPMIDEHMSWRKDHTWRLWSLISFVAWREEIAKVPVLSPEAPIQVSAASS